MSGKSRVILAQRLIKLGDTEGGHPEPDEGSHGLVAKDTLTGNIEQRNFNEPHIG